MPKSKDLKRLVRTRMTKTGESYTAARTQLLEKKKKGKQSAVPPSDYAKVAGMSDAAVEKATGCSWKLWIQALDCSKAFEMKHRDIAKYILEKYDISGWWAQTVTVGYERIRGLREKGQQRDGGYNINKSKTIPVPIRDLYQAFATKRARSRWLGEVDIKVKKSTVDKSVRFLWADGTPLEVHFWSKGAAKSQVQLQHRGLPSKAAADKMRAYWTERMAALTRSLAPSKR